MNYRSGLIVRFSTNKIQVQSTPFAWVHLTLIALPDCSPHCFGLIGMKEAGISSALFCNSHLAGKGLMRAFFAETDENVTAQAKKTAASA